MAAYLFSKLSTLALVLLTQVVYTSAHGFVQDIVVGVKYSLAGILSTIREICLDHQLTGTFDPDPSILTFR